MGTDILKNVRKLLLDDDSARNILAIIFLVGYIIAFVGTGYFSLTYTNDLQSAASIMTSVMNYPTYILVSILSWYFGVSFGKTYSKVYGKKRKK